MEERSNSIKSMLYSKRPRCYIKRWDHRTLIDAFVAVLQGKRRSGKTVLARYLMKKTSKQFSGGVLFSGTEKLSPYLGQFMHKNVVHHGLDVNIFKALIANRVEAIGQFNEKLSTSEIARNKKDKMWSTLIILEDCLKNFQEWKSLGATFDLFFNGRHADMGLLLLTQEAKCIPPPCRGNVEYLFLFQENNPRNLSVIYNEYCKFIPETIFYQLMEKVGKQYHCIVIDMNDKSSNSWQDKVFWYKAELDEQPFRFGSDAFWEQNDKMVAERIQHLYRETKRAEEEKKRQEQLKEEEAKQIEQNKIKMEQWIKRLGVIEQDNPTKKKRRHF